MKGNEHVKTTTNIIYPAFALFAFACFALSPHARAQCPQGCDMGNNTWLGSSALSHNTGSNNSAFGAGALGSNTTGSDNTANGYFALHKNSTSNENTATGSAALFNNTIGSFNTANGSGALVGNISGSENTANGVSALYGNTTGSFNTANGINAICHNTTGSYNTADGGYALYFNTTGNYNTAHGFTALGNNTIANNNTADGLQALKTNTGGSNTAIGSKALLRNSTGSFNIGLRVSAGAFLTTGSNNIAIGNYGVAGESNTIRIGQVQTRTFIKGISGVAIAGAQVVVNAGGQLGVAPSSADFKHEIRPMGEESEVIFAFKPVSFCYDQDIDEQSLPQFGLVAEDVEKVNPDLVVRDEAGKPYSVRYDQVNAMLLNEFLKEHAKVEQLKKDFESKIAEQQKQIKALAAGLQKVSAQLELSKPAPQTAENNR